MRDMAKVSLLPFARIRKLKLKQNEIKRNEDDWNGRENSRELVAATFFPVPATYFPDQVLTSVSPCWGTRVDNVRMGLAKSTAA